MDRKIHAAKKKSENLDPNPEVEVVDGKLLAIRGALSQIERKFGKGTLQVCLHYDRHLETFSQDCSVEIK